MFIVECSRELSPGWAGTRAPSDLSARLARHQPMRGAG